MTGISTLAESEYLYDAVIGARGDIGAPGGLPIPPANGQPLTAPIGGYNMQSEAGHQALWDGVQARRKATETARTAPPLVRLWDGDFNFRGVVAGWRECEFEFVENDTGIATIKLSLNHYLAKWVMNYRGRKKRNVIVTIDKQGARWSGLMDNYKVVMTKGNDAYLEITFKHDYEQAKHILCWANPFLLAEVQFPKIWLIFGPAKWCLLVTLFVNIFRLETAIWTIPDNPLDITEWFPFSLNMGEWRNVIKPFNIFSDNSNLSIVFSRFKSWHDVAKPILADAQLTVTCRRYIATDDPHPYVNYADELGLRFKRLDKILQFLHLNFPVRNGCVIWDIVDNSGWGSETVFGGSFLVGFLRAVVSIADDGYTEGIDVYTGAPTFPSEYYNPWFLGTNPRAPWVVFDCNLQYSGVTSAEFTYYEATDVRFVQGGHSMPGVNEVISAGINMAGDFLTSIINTIIDSALNVGPFGAGFIQIPPLGGVIDALAKILYEDTFLAFIEVPTLRAADLGAVNRLLQSLPISGLEVHPTSLGDFHYEEGWCEGAERAFTLAGMMAIRSKIWATRTHFAHKIQVVDEAPYLIGEQGFGHFWLGNRVGTTVPEFPIPFTVFVERVNSLKYKWDQNGPKGWEIKIGYAEPQDPALKALNWIKNISQAGNMAGIL